MFQKGKYGVAIEVGHGECMRPSAGSLSGEQYEQPKRISIARNRGRRGVPLTDKSFAKEGFEKGVVPVIAES
ncbi:MAG: hypothetical protein U0270_11090 [Labilithrix sp.]